MIKIAIFGGTGLLGSTLFHMYHKIFDVKIFSRTNETNTLINNNILIDFSKFDFSLFEEWRPNIIINAIALTNLQRCEEHHSDADFANCEIAKKLSKLAHINNSYFIHLSTDHFFHDSKDKHSETDPIIIQNYYAKSKLLAEENVLKLSSKAIIVRTNIVGYAYRKEPSFFEWLTYSLKYQKPITLFEDYYTSPISTYELASLLIKCYEHSLYGIYNIASSEVISKYTFGLKTASVFGYSTSNIIKGKANQELADLKRCLTLGLDVSKIENALNMPMPKIDDTLKILYKYYGVPYEL